MSSKIILTNKNGKNVTITNLDSNFNDREIKADSIVQHTPDRDGLKNTIGAVGDVILQKDIALQYEWVEPQLEDNGGTIINPNGDGSGSWKAIYEGPVNVKWFGAKGDGVTDDTDAIKKINAFMVSNNGDVVLTSNNKICLTTVGLSFGGVNNVEIYDFKLKIKDGTTNNKDASGIMVHNVSNLSLSNSSFDLNRDNRIYGTNIDSHAFNMRSCWNISVKDCSFINSFQDGMYVNVDYDLGYEAISKNAVFENCTFDNNWRQGVSLIAARDFTFINCSFTNTNAPEDNNHEYAPEAGVDLESNATNILHSIMDISFISCDFSGNNGQGILITSTQTPKNINFFDSTVEFNKWSAIRVSGQNITFRDTKIKAGEIDGLYGLIRLNSTEDMKNIHFYNTTISDYVDGDYSGYYKTLEIKPEAGENYLAPSFTFDGLYCDYNGVSKWYLAQGGCNDLLINDVIIENSNLDTVHYYVSSSTKGVTLSNIKFINSTARAFYIDGSSNIVVDGVKGYDLKEITDNYFIYITNSAPDCIIKNVKTRNINNTDDIQMKGLYIRTNLLELSNCDIRNFTTGIYFYGVDYTLTYFNNNFVDGAKFIPVGIDTTFKTNDDTPQNITVTDGVITKTEDA